MNIPDLLTELGKQMGLEGLKLDGDGVCRLVFDGKFAVDFESAEDGKVLHVYTILSPLPGEGLEALSLRLLGANLFGQGTGGAVFAVDPDPGEVVFFRTFDMERIDFQDFIGCLESFVNHVEGWIGEIARIPSDAVAEPAEGPPPGESGTEFIRA